MDPAYLENWEPEPHSNACECSSRVIPAGKYDDQETLFYANDGGRARAMEPRVRLAAAAPALVRALLAVEWGGDDGTCMCSPDGSQNPMSGHSMGCPLDAALTAAGFDTQEKRNEARRRIVEGKR